MPKPGHWLRDDPHPDELDQEYCETCEILCMPGRPCLCCHVMTLKARTGPGPCYGPDCDHISHKENR